MLEYPKLVYVIVSPGVDRALSSVSRVGRIFVCKIWLLRFEELLFFSVIRASFENVAIDVTYRSLTFNAVSDVCR